MCLRSRKGEPTEAALRALGRRPLGRDGGRQGAAVSPGPEDDAGPAGPRLGRGGGQPGVRGPAGGAVTRLVGRGWGAGLLGSALSLLKRASGRF